MSDRSKELLGGRFNHGQDVADAEKGDDEENCDVQFHALVVRSGLDANFARWPQESFCPILNARDATLLRFRMGRHPDPFSAARATRRRHQSIS